MTAAVHGRVSSWGAVRREVEISCCECEAHAADRGALLGGRIPLVLLIDILAAVDGNGTELGTSRLSFDAGRQCHEDEANRGGRPELKSILSHLQTLPFSILACFRLLSRW